MVLEEQMIAARLSKAGGGKSGLRRAGWFLTGTGGDPRESATERRPPAVAAAMRVRVKG